MITDCVNKGNVAGLDDTNVGGLVGYISFGTLEESRTKAVWSEVTALTTRRLEE